MVAPAKDSDWKKLLQNPWQFKRALRKLVPKYSEDETTDEKRNLCIDTDGGGNPCCESG